MLPAVRVFIGIICAIRALERGLKMRAERRVPPVVDGRMFFEPGFLAGVVGGVGRTGGEGAGEENPSGSESRSGSDRLSSGSDRLLSGSDRSSSSEEVGGLVSGV